jgi:excisionase family DNA binding protein
MFANVNGRKPVNPKDRHWLTIMEAAKYLSVSRQTLYAYMNEGTLPYYELKGKRGRRLRREDLDGLLTRGLVGAEELVESSEEG